MDTQRLPNHGYALGHSAAEQQRLIVQAARYDRYTEQLLREAGIARGMRVLDAGCGVGDVSLLVARLVGPEGAVVGIDQAPEALATARARVQAAGLTQACFVEAAIDDELAFERPFDAAVSRFILMHLADPVAGLRAVKRQVRPGGILAFQESDFTIRPFTYPPSPLFERWLRVLLPPAQASVARHMGLRLYATFQSAGLPPPQLRLDIPIGGGADFPGYTHLASNLRVLGPLSQQRYRVTFPEGEDPETFVERLRDEISAAGGVFALMPVVGAWARKPAA